MRDEGVIYVAGHPLLNRRCTRLPGCIRLQNDLYCVGWGVKLYSLTHVIEDWRHLLRYVAACRRVRAAYTIYSICLYVHVCFVLPWTVESFPFMFWRWRNKLKWAPSSFLLPPHYCGLGAGFIPLRAIVNNKQCETRGLFMSLVIRYWIGDVQDCQGVSASKMTCIVSGGALNSTHSRTS